VRIPILGRIAAGVLFPIPESDFSYFGPDDLIEVSPEFLPARTEERELFALKVQGDGLIDALIADGDIVILRPAVKVKNGNLAAIWLPRLNETALGYYYRDSDGYQLQPANSAMKPVYIKSGETLEVKGIVVLLMRKFAESDPDAA
jgi:repressor LexA